MSCVTLVPDDPLTRWIESDAAKMKRRILFATGRLRCFVSVRQKIESFPPGENILRFHRICPIRFTRHRVLTVKCFSFVFISERFADTRLRGIFPPLVTTDRERSFFFNTAHFEWKHGRTELELVTRCVEQEMQCCAQRYKCLWCSIFQFFSFFFDA